MGAAAAPASATVKDPMARLHWVEQPRQTDRVAATWLEKGFAPGDPAVPRVFYALDNRGREQLHALVGREEWVPGDHRWHISVSGPARVPTWSEIAAACHELRPGVPFVMGVPPRSRWMNVHSDVLHCWETKDAALLDQWAANARGDAPT